MYILAIARKNYGKKLCDNKLTRCFTKVYFNLIFNYIIERNSQPGPHSFREN